MKLQTAKPRNAANSLTEAERFRRESGIGRWLIGAQASDPESGLCVCPDTLDPRGFLSHTSGNGVTAGPELLQLQINISLAPPQTAPVSLGANSASSPQRTAPLLITGINVGCRYLEKPIRRQFWREVGDKEGREGERSLGFNIAKIKETSV